MRKGNLALIFVLLLVTSGCASQSQNSKEGGIPSYSDLIEQSDSQEIKATYDVNSSIREYQDLSFTYYRLDGRDKIVATQETAGGTFITSSHLMENGTVVCETQPNLGKMETTCKPEKMPESHITVLPDRWSLENLSERSAEGCRAFEADLDRTENKRSPLNQFSRIDFCLDTDRKLFTRFNISSEEGYLSLKLENTSRPETSKLELPRKVGIAGHCLGSYEVDLTPLRDIDKATFSIGEFNKTVELPEQFEMGVYSFPEDVLSKGSNEIKVYAGGEVQTKSCYSD